jgi:O-antigen ligase
MSGRALAIDSAGPRRRAYREPLPGLLAAVSLLAMAAAVGVLAAASPEAAVMVAAALALLFVLGIDLAYGVVLYVVAAFTVLGDNPRVATALAGALAVAWIAWQVTSTHRKVPALSDVPALAWTVGLLLAWIAIATLWAPDSGAAHATLVRFACGLVLFPVIYAAVDGERRLLWVLLAMVGGGAIAGLSGLMDFGGSGQYGDRAGGLIADPNTLGMTLLPAVVLGPLLGLRVIPAQRPGLRVAVLCASVIGVVTIALTGSRGALVALVAVAVCAPVVLGRWRGAAAGVVALGLLFAVVTYATVVPADVRARLTSTTTSGRGDLWTITTRMIADQPILGVGTGNYTQASPRYLIRPGGYANEATTARVLSHVERSNGVRIVVDHQPVVAHNSYLQMWAETGIAGLVLYLALLGGAIVSGIRAARVFERMGADTLDLAVRGLVLTAAGLVVAMAFLTYTDYGRPVWVILALIVAARGLSRRMQDADDPSMVRG